MTYTCRNNDPSAPDVQWVQAGWEPTILTAGADLTRIPRMVRITSQWLDIPCGHTDRATDPECDGCGRNITTEAA